MSRAVACAVFPLVAVLCGCTSAVFNRPVSMSTRSDAVHVVRRLGPVAVERCDTIVVVVPFAHDPAEAYDELLERAKRAGGNAVLDVQIHATSVALAVPVFTRTCLEVTGTAAIIDGT